VHLDSSYCSKKERPIYLESIAKSTFQGNFSFKSTTLEVTNWVKLRNLTIKTLECSLVTKFAVLTDFKSSEIISLTISVVDSENLTGFRLIRLVNGCTNLKSFSVFNVQCFDKSAISRINKSVFSQLTELSIFNMDDLLFDWKILKYLAPLCSNLIKFMYKSEIQFRDELEPKHSINEAKLILKFIEGNPNLQTIVLDYVMVTVELMEFLSTGCSDLKILTCGFCSFSNYTIVHVGNIVKNHPKIEIVQCRITKNQSVVYRNKNNRKIVELNEFHIWNPELYEPICEAEFPKNDDDFVSFLLSLNNINEFIFTGCDFSNDSLNATFKNNQQSLSHLTFKECDVLEWEGLSFLIEYSPKLTYCHLINSLFERREIMTLFLEPSTITHLKITNHAKFDTNVVNKILSKIPLILQKIELIDCPLCDLDAIQNHILTNNLNVVICGVNCMFVSEGENKTTKNKIQKEPPLPQQLTTTSATVNGGGVEKKKNCAVM
jgi:hypothetical protein